MYMYPHRVSLHVYMHVVCTVHSCGLYYIVCVIMLHSTVLSTLQVVDGLKEELGVAQAKLNRLQHEADTKVLARATNNNGSRHVGGVGGVANTVPSSLEVKAPPVELRSSGEVMELVYWHNL